MSTRKYGQVQITHPHPERSSTANGPARPTSLTVGTHSDLIPQTVRTHSDLIPQRGSSNTTNIQLLLLVMNNVMYMYMYILVGEGIKGLVRKGRVS